MSCFFFFKKEKKFNGKGREPRSEPAEMTNISVPASDDGMTSRSEVSAGARQSGERSSAQRSIPSLFDEKAHNLRVFQLRELRGATNDFSKLLRLGEGGFGSVYKGFVKPVDGKGDMITVAVKKLDQRGKQGHKQWLAEVQFLGVIQHPNLVKLIGYCGVDGERGIERLLVYEFMPNMSLEDHLFRRANEQLSWNLRLKITLGAAEGLAYLHEGLEVQVIYRDFKAANILLDKDFNAKLSDFGLAREGPAEGRTHVSTTVVGTHGYAAPDYIETGHLTVKSDVWGFGVFLYEIVTGRHALERNRPRNEQKLLEWVKQYPPDTGTFAMIIDPRLRNHYSIDAAREIAWLANRCLAKDAKARPKMSEVVQSLKQAIQLSELPMKANSGNKR